VLLASRPSRGVVSCVALGIPAHPPKGGVPCYPPRGVLRDWSRPVPGSCRGPCHPLQGFSPTGTAGGTGRGGSTGATCPNNGGRSSDATQDPRLAPGWCPRPRQTPGTPQPHPRLWSPPPHPPGGPAFATHDRWGRTAAASQRQRRARGDGRTGPRRSRRRRRGRRLHSPRRGVSRRRARQGRGGRDLDEVGGRSRRGRGGRSPTGAVGGRRRGRLHLIRRGCSTTEPRRRRRHRLWGTGGAKAGGGRRRRRRQARMERGRWHLDGGPAWARVRACEGARPAAAPARRALRGVRVAAARGSGRRRPTGRYAAVAAR